MGRFIMDIKGLANTTLTDYPGLVAATLFTGGCDFCCPFCHNRSLVVHHEKLPSLPVEDVLEFLSRRKVALEGVCITGGEPLLQNDLGDFIRELKAMGYKIKLDTNGYDPTHLDHLLKDGLVDYVAMDIKGAQSNYAKASGCPNLDLTRIKLSVDILKGSDVDYEFRTTVVRDLHSAQDMEAIGQWLYGAKAYYLQPYVESEDIIMPVFSSYSKAEMVQFQKMLQQYIPYVGLRGYART